MSNPTSNFGWQMPTPTDLVTDLPADFEVFGQAVDSSLADLKGGTSGQVLSKNSNTDMDFVWVTDAAGDITGVTAGTGISGGGTSGTVTITNSMATEITAKGDLIVGTGSATFDNLAAGANGETLVADSSTSTGLRYQSNFAAGKNAILNGAFNVWQRGTSVAAPGAGGAFLADRFTTSFDVAPTSGTITQQTFTPGTAPVAGYEGTYFNRTTVTTVGTSAYYIMAQKIEDVRTFAGQTVTVSFWAKLNSGAISTPRIRLTQNFGSGGSASVSYDSSYNYTPTGSWQRFSWTIALSSISGKTVGTSSYLQFDTVVPYTAANAVDTWGWQVEAGNTATAFQTATGTLQGELAAAQRYYYLLASGAGFLLANGIYISATQFSAVVPLPVTMRSAPTLSATSGTNYYSTYNGASDLLNSLTIFSAGTTVSGVYNSSEAAGTQFRPAYVETNNAAAFVAFSAEL